MLDRIYKDVSAGKKSRCRFIGKGSQKSCVLPSLSDVFPAVCLGCRSYDQKEARSCAPSPGLHPALSWMQELLKNIAKHLDAFLGFKYFWHFSPFLLHQHLHL